MRTIILLLSIITHLNLHAMKRLRPSADTCATKDTPATKKLCPPSENLCPLPKKLYLPTEMLYQILKACPYNKGKLKTVVTTMISLASTHTALYSCYNNEQTFNELLNIIHKIRHWSHESVARFMCPPKARKQLKHQKELKSLLLSGRPLNGLEKKLKKLIDKKVRFDFTYNYNAHPHTPLMFNIPSEVFNFMLDNGSNINEATSNGITVLMMACEPPLRQTRVSMIIENQGVAINQTNNRGETALLRCLRVRKNQYVSDQFASTIKEMLEKGADPLQSDKSGYTPLLRARELRSGPGNSKIVVVNLIKQAIDKKSKEK